MISGVFSRAKPQQPVYTVRTRDMDAGWRAAFHAKIVFRRRGLVTAWHNCIFAFHSLANS